MDDVLAVLDEAVGECSPPLPPLGRRFAFSEDSDRRVTEWVGARINLVTDSRS